jgi:hypothetical protein
MQRFTNALLLILFGTLLWLVAAPPRAQSVATVELVLPLPHDRTRMVCAQGVAYFEYPSYGGRGIAPALDRDGRVRPCRGV